MSERFRLRDRAESFGRVAEDYDRVRPPYPDALIVELAARGGTEVLDVGCGTGIAARLLAARGLHVLGVEVDPGMAAVARRRGTEVEVARFERWDNAGRRFDLVTSAQAWHWIDPVAGARKAAAVLRPGGSVGLFWNTSEIDAAQAPAIEAAYRGAVPQLERGRRGEPELDAVVAALEDAGFVGASLRAFPWERTLPREDWLILLSTFSDHSTLPADEWARLRAALHDAAAERVVLHYETRLVSAFWQG